MSEIKHTPYSGTPEQRANLEKLIAYCEGLPADYRDFDMADYRSDDSGPGVAHHACGTTACFIGHAPQAGVSAWANEDWEDYATRAFGCSWLDEQWIWLFGSSWRLLDNTVSGAAARARYLLDAGCPDNCHDQQTGEAPLSYVKAEAGA